MHKIRECFWRVFFISLFIIFACLGISGQSHAIEPKITDIVITNNAENVLLYAKLVNSFKTEMESSILAGVPSVFTLQMDVYRVRSYLWDKKITSYEIKRTIKYDNLKKTFSIFTNGDIAPVIFPDFESAQKAMADLSGIAIAPLKALVKGNNYYLKMKVKIDKIRLPLHMEYIFLFVSFWDFETAWYKQNFSY
jgi:hypothetical protein